MSYTQQIGEYPVALVEFFASWCPHCQKMMPVVAQVKQDLGPQAPVFQYDIDLNRELAQEAGVEGVPTFIVYVRGSEVWRYSGEIAGEELLSTVRSFE